MSELDVATRAVQTDAERRVLNRPVVVIVAAVIAGSALDLLAWGRAPGYGLALTLGLLTGVVWLAVELGQRAEGRDRLLLAVAMLLALTPAVRSAPSVVTVATLTWIGVMAVAVMSTRDGQLRSWTMTRYVLAGLEWAAGALDGVLAFLYDLSPSTFGASRVRRSGPAVRGVLMALMAVLFFGVILSAADPIFGSVISDALDIDLSLGRYIRFAVVGVGSALLILGLARRALRAPSPPTSITFQARGATEATFVLAAVNLLFLGFLAVQARYLFVGEVARVELGYAEYARRGFFELVFVVFCVLGLVLATDWIVQRRGRFLDGLHVLLVLQTFVVMASAVVRMNAYTDQFGLSELRLLVFVFMGWLAILLAAAVFTVLRSRRATFAFVAFSTGLAMTLALVAMNPHGLIASHNIERAVDGAPLDLEYLASLSSDADPALIRGLGSGASDALLVEQDRSVATVDVLLAERQADLVRLRDQDGWRSWSVANARALNAHTHMSD